jgi:hypothetical protein
MTARTLLPLLAGLALAACASDVVKKPAGIVSQDIASLQAGLTGFQTSWRDYQATEQTRTTGYGTRARAATAATRQMRTQWALTAAPTEAEAFAVLQAHADAETAALVPAAHPPKLEDIKFPADKLGEVVAATAGLAKGPSREEAARSILAYGRELNSELKAVEGAAKSASEAATAAEAGKSGDKK